MGVSVPRPLGIAVMAVAVACLAACGVTRYYEPRASWRSDAENACIASGQVHASAYVQPISVSGGIACGMDNPLKVSAVADGRIAVNPPATINCPMTAALGRWLSGPVQQASRAYFGEPVVAIHQIASYSCRGRDSSHFGPLSEHAFGNAIDVAGFILADGHEVTVVNDAWHGGARERGFLHAAFASACDEFYTVLGPGSDAYHYNHFHLDLLVTNARGGRHYCHSFLMQPQDRTASIQSAPQSGQRLLSFVGPRE